MAKTLSERVINALSNEAMRSADLEALIAETKAECERLTGAMQQANEDALNLGLGDEEREGAAARADRARRDILALGKAVEQLEAKHASRVAGEQNQATAARRKALIAERDRIAGELQAEWPGIEARIVALLTAVTSNAARMKAAGIHKADAEAVARGLPGNFANGSILFRQLSKIALPSFANGQELAWPVPDRPARHWTEEVAEDRRKQAEAHRQQAIAEAAAWAEYTVAAGTVSMMTEVRGRAGRKGPDAGFTLYPESVGGNGRFDTSPRRIWLHSRDAAFLRKAGAIVEAVQVEAVP